MRNGGELSIYWTPGPAPNRSRLLRQAWLGYRGRASVSYPTTGELVTHDGVGPLPELRELPSLGTPTRVFEVHGDILNPLQPLGGSAWLTDHR